jgi:SAM-dependent methyltransferase
MSPDSIAHKVTNPARALRRRLLKQKHLRAASHSTSKEVWEGSLDEEVDFWKQYIETGGWKWPGDFTYRLDPESLLQDFITEPLEHDVGTRVRLLDCGAGPLTLVGKRWPGHDLEVVAVDALAEHYDKLLAESNVTPPVRTQHCDTEKLTEMFEPDSFDIVYARNSLDHHYEPLVAIRQMLTVTKPGGAVFMQHAANEAERELYSGMHQWNFDWVDDDAVIWRPGKRWSMREEFSGQATVTGSRVGIMVTTKLKKAPTAA